MIFPWKEMLCSGIYFACLKSILNLKHSQKKDEPHS